MAPITFDNPAVQAYILYSAILAVKLLALGPITGFTRMAKGTFASPEDAKLLKGKVKTDETVERIRRAHLNDLENIPAFWILGVLYLTTGPNVVWASLLFKMYTAARVSHTIFYTIIAAQPFRGLSWMIAFVIMLYMAVHVILQNITAL
ncbi:microsomal glutathione S-transferase 1-like [Amyelois transitella]|uniref:microsomal glutathione S-transferase 1-like n=1 Tax=Amyelois transitella TaxID=680683 RepID=UPI00298FDFC8|nr:microsomal glutathione S-transferase 1-like [Amyelois transitella]